MSIMMSKIYWRLYRSMMTDSQVFRSTVEGLVRHQGAPFIEIEEAIRRAVEPHIGSERERDWMSHLLSATSQAEIVSRWQQIPLMTRADLREAGKSIAPGEVIASSGGSTGEPVKFAISKQALSDKRSRIVAARLRMGWSPGIRTIGLWGSDADLGRGCKWTTAALAWAQHYLEQFEYRAGFRTEDSVWRNLANEISLSARPVALYGYTSLLRQFALFLERNGCSIPEGKISASWNGAEGMAASEADYMSQQFGVRVHNLYGARETGVMAIGGLAGGPLAVVGPSILIEVVNEAGCPVSQGELGEIAVSVLSPGGTGVFRYLIGDKAIAGRSHHSRLGLVELEAVVGRSNDTIQLENGQEVLGIALNHALKAVHGLYQFQCRVDSKGRRARLVLDGNVDLLRGQMAGIEQEVGQLLTGYEVTVVSDASRLVPTSHGKLRQVIVDR